MSNKEYVVFGLGRFGSSVAKQLEYNGCKVLAVDKDPELVKAISDFVTYAVCADVTNEDALKELGVRNFDGAVIAIGETLEAAVVATIWAKEQGVKSVVAKVSNALHAKILKKMGADEVTFPEYEMGVHLANTLAMGDMFDTIEVSENISIVDIKPLDSWVGKTLIELRLREKYHINVVGIKHHGNLSILPVVDNPIRRSDVLVVMGKNEDLKKLAVKNK